jgi:uncharacterized protein with PCYCGC motif
MLFAALLAGCSSGEPAREPVPQPPAESTPSIVAAPDRGPNKVLDAAAFTDARVRDAYVAAKKYAHVLESIYCYCRCKENIGHRALVECFESDHASHCDVCMNEAMIAARMTEQGKTPKEIQKAIDAFYAG